MQSSNGMSEHKWLTSRRLQEAYLHISPELNWNSAPLTSSYSPGVCGRKQRPAQHNKTINHQWSTDKQTKWAEGNLTTAFCVSSPEVNEAYCRVSKKDIWEAANSMHEEGNWIRREGYWYWNLRMLSSQWSSVVVVASVNIQRCRPSHRR